MRHKKKHTAICPDDVIETFARLVMEAIPLAERIFSDQYTADDRRRMRDLAGGDGVFRLSNLLNGLCSETSRGLLRGERETLERLQRLGFTSLAPVVSKRYGKRSPRKNEPVPEA